jgi:hypothetical protein
LQRTTRERVVPTPCAGAHVGNGTLAIYIDDEKVDEGKIRTQPSRFSIAGEGLTIGRGSGEPVTDDWTFARPWAFTGTIKRVVSAGSTPFSL